MSYIKRTNTNNYMYVCVCVFVCFLWQSGNLPTNNPIMLQFYVDKRLANESK